VASSKKLRFVFWPRRQISLIYLSFVLLMALEGMHVNFLSHTVNCNSGARSQFFAERVVKLWNSLPSSTNFATLSPFRQSIMNVDFSAFLKVFSISSFVWSCHSVVGHFIVFILDICTCFITVFGNFVCFIRAAISTPGAWLSCLSSLDARVVSLLDVL